MSVTTYEGKQFRHKDKAIVIEVVEDNGTEVIAENVDTGETVTIDYTFALHWTDQPVLKSDDGIDLDDWA